MSQNNPNETPGPITRARSKTPLPAVNARQSHAYGASGKAELHSQVRSISTSFAEEFQSGRNTTTRAPSAAASSRISSVDEEEDTAAVQPSPVRKAGRAQRTTRMSTVAEGESTEMAGGGVPATAPISGRRNDTIMDGGAEYAGPTARIRAEMQRRVCEPNFLMWLFWILLALSGLGALFSGSFSSGAAAPSSPILSRMRQMLPYRYWGYNDVITRELPLYNVPETQWALNGWFRTRLEKLEKRVTTIESDMRLTTDTLAEMKQMLPEKFAMRFVDGHYEIPEDFWLAIQEKLSRDSDLAPLWQQYLLRNAQQLEELYNKWTGSIIDAALEKRQIVSVDTFLASLQKNNDWLADRYKNQFSEMRNEMNLRAERIAHDAAIDMMERFPAAAYASQQIEILVRANMIHDAYQSIRAINWFSPFLGAIVNPQVTSPVAATAKGLKNAYKKISPMQLLPHPPVEALHNWQEATNCFCGAPDAYGAVQIGVLLPAPIYPDRLVIEHIPMEGTIDPDSTPRDFEVWADMGSAAKARRWNELMDERAPFHSCQGNPGDTWVCIGQNEYRRDAHNHIQVFTMRVNAELMAMSTQSVIVRFTSNYGADWTCLYRLRLTGQRVE